MSSKRASYREAIAWIAWNDEPTEYEVERIEPMVSVQLVADIFGKWSYDVARAVSRYRERHNIS